MFGENGIYGKSIHSMDSKCRIILPKDTCVETQEKLCFYKENELTFRIYSLRTLQKEIARLEQKIKRSTIENQEKNKQLLDDLVMRIMDYTSADAQRRIVIPNSIVDEYKLEKSLIFHGGHNHLKIFKDEETYNEYVKSLQKRK